jgi:hypothetical protein
LGVALEGCRCFGARPRRTRSTRHCGFNASLRDRPDRTQEVAGSSPASSIKKPSKSQGFLLPEVIKTAVISNWASELGIKSAFEPRRAFAKRPAPFAQPARVLGLQRDVTTPGTIAVLPHPDSRRARQLASCSRRSSAMSPSPERPPAPSAASCLRRRKDVCASDPRPVPHRVPIR